MPIACRYATTGYGVGVTGSLIVPECGFWKANMVIRLPRSDLPGEASAVPMM
jgi:hypothetical protein